MESSEPYGERATFQEICRIDESRTGRSDSGIICRSIMIVMVVWNKAQLFVMSPKTSHGMLRRFILLQVV